MRQRISAGGIVVDNNRVLLVHHCQENAFDFWVMPGGGVEGNEGILKAAEREVLQETNLTVNAERIAYIEDFIDGDKYVCKFWVYCGLTSGNLTTDNKDLDEPFLVDARFFSQEEVQDLNVFPPILKHEFWQDLEAGFQHIKYLGFKLYE